MIVVSGLAAMLTFAAPSAFGFQTRSSGEAFGSDGTQSSAFFYPWSLGVDQSTGDIYVASLDGTVRKFNSAHELQDYSGVPFGLSPVSEYGNQLAVDASTHHLYVVGNSSAVRVYKDNAEAALFSAGEYAGTNEIVGNEICGVAVDVDGDIYVSEHSTGVRIFESSGESLTTIPVIGACNLAVDPHGNVYINELNGPVEKYVASQTLPVTSSTNYTSLGVMDPNTSSTVAVDPVNNHIYVDEIDRVAEYDEAGTRLGTFGESGSDALVGSAGVAINAESGRAYVSNSEGSSRQVKIFEPPFLLPDVVTGEATNVSPKGTVTLNGTVNSDGIEVTSCYFTYGTSSEYGQVVECQQSVGASMGEIHVTAEPSGLAPGKTYHYKLQAANANGVNMTASDATFSTPPLPVINGASVTDLSGSSADLHARIDPGGLRTSFHIEYGTNTEYGQNTPTLDEQIGDGVSYVAIERHLEGLNPDTTYHWRVIATNEAGTSIGVDHTFVYDTNGEVLPDGRGYEMVTPLQKNAALIGPVFVSLPDIAEDGSHLIAATIQCFGNAESCTGSRDTVGEPVLFSRSRTAWTAASLAPPSTQFDANSYWLASAEAGTALFSMPTPPMSEDDFYGRTAAGSLIDIGPATPSVAGAQGEPWGGRTIVATSDFSHVLFQEPGAFWPLTAGAGFEPYELRESDRSSPIPVGVGPGNSDLISKCNTLLGASINGVDAGELSANGETVYFTAEACAEGGTGEDASRPVLVNEVYARIGGRQTVPISEPAAFSSAAPYGGCRHEPCIRDVNNDENWTSADFAGASNDGSKAFFTSAQQMSDAATQNSMNLYEYDFDRAEGEGHLIDISGGDSSGHGPRVEGVIGLSADGSHVYFVAQGVLSLTPNANGEVPRDGGNNLYVFSRDAGQSNGVIAFIAGLPVADQALWAGNGTDGLANVTPDGRFLVFGSHGDLTPDATRTDGSTQVYRYDARANELLRISVGARGFNDNGNSGVGNAEIVPAFHGWEHAGASRSDPTMSHDGDFVFFQSPVGLTPHALDDFPIGKFNGQTAYAENVYEWHAGDVYLVSDGKDTQSALLKACEATDSTVCLIGSDATGANVFFTTADSLVPSDGDTQLDYYDARICHPTEGAPCITSVQASLPPCREEACHGIPRGVPEQPNGGTLTLSGNGITHESLSTRTGRRHHRVRCRSHERGKHIKCAGPRSKRKRGKQVFRRVG